MFSSNFGRKLPDGLELELITDRLTLKELDPNTVFYYYDGPLDDKTRDFCRELLILGKFFTQEDIDKLSNKSGYDVDLYFGSFNCRHRWKFARIKGKIRDGYVPDGPTTTDINRVGRESIFKQ